MELLGRLFGLMVGSLCLVACYPLVFYTKDSLILSAILAALGVLIVTVSAWPNRKSAKSRTNEPGSPAARLAEQRSRTREEWAGESAPRPALLADTIHSKVRGVAFANQYGPNRQHVVEECRIGETLNLVRDPRNEHDPNAVKVMRGNGVQLGWIGKGLAVNLAQWMDAGQRFQVRICDITGGEEGHTHGCNIEIKPL